MGSPGVHFALALTVGSLLAIATPTLAHAEDHGMFTTRETTTTSSSTDATTGVTTTKTVTERERDSDRDWRDRDNRSDRDRRYWQGRNDPDRTSDLDARYPYDSTGGQNRSDVDAVRSGFDDPRNPWDGRYMNDNPRNAANGAGSNATVNHMRGNENAYRPGNYGTHAVHHRH